MITIIDYGMSNLRSVAKAFLAAGADHVIISDRIADLQNADKIVLPGQGGFPDGMNNLKAHGLVEVLKEEILKKGKPFLGICLGMQVLADVGYEHRETAGLGIIPGITKKLSLDIKTYKLPHVGWDNISYSMNCPLFSNLPKEPDFYFVHSYVLQPTNENIVVATCDYGTTFPVVIWHENIFTTLFHPEKSQKNGLILIQNFLKLKV